MVKGAINLAIQRIIQAKPTIRIAIITPMWRQRFSSGDDKDSDFNTFDGKYLKEYVNAVKEMARQESKEEDKDTEDDLDIEEIETLKDEDFESYNDFLEEEISADSDLMSSIG